MTIEEQLKEYILERYKSLRAFVEAVGLPYNTVNGILIRGIKNANSENIFKICDTLNISADELGKGRIVPRTESVQTRDLSHLRTYYYTFRELDGVPLSEKEKEFLDDGTLLIIEQIRKKREKNNNKE